MKTIIIIIAVLIIFILIFYIIINKNKNSSLPNIFSKDCTDPANNDKDCAKEATKGRG